MNKQNSEIKKYVKKNPEFLEAVKFTGSKESISNLKSLFGNEVYTMDSGDVGLRNIFTGGITIITPDTYVVKFPDGSRKHYCCDEFDKKFKEFVE